MVFPLRRGEGPMDNVRPGRRLPRRSNTPSGHGEYDRPEAGMYAIALIKQYCVLIP